MRPIGIILLVALLVGLVYSQRGMFIKGLADEVKKELGSAASDSTGDQNADDVPSIEALLKEGERFYAEHDLTAAEVAFQKAILVQPQDPRAYAHLGLIRSEQNDFEAALYFSQSALDRSPEEIGYLVNLGKAYAQLGRRDEAIAQWKKALEINPNHDTARELILKETSDNL